MLNRIQFEGIILNLWRYGGTRYARMLHRPDAGQNERDILMTARFQQHAPLDIRRGDLLRVWGFLDNRPMGNDSGNDSYVAEIVTDGIIRLGRNQLPGGRGSSKATADTENTEGAGDVVVAEQEGETVEA
jgi:hypothetical protein